MTKTTPVPAGSGTSPHRRAELALCIVVVIWGLNIPLVKYALGFAHPLFFNCARLVLSAICLGTIDVFEKRRNPGREPIPWFDVIRVGLIGSLFYQLAFICGMEFTTSGNAALILASIPMWTAILATWTKEERLGRWEWAGLSLAFLGTAIVTFDDRIDLSSNNTIGNLLILGAALLWSCGTILTRRAMVNISPNRLAFCMTTTMLPLHFLVSLPFLARGTTGGNGFWLAVVFSGLLSTGVGYSLWNYGVQRIGSSHAAIFQNMAPVIALIASWLLLGEAVKTTQLLGGPMILAGLILMRYKRHRAAKASAAVS